MDKTIATSMGLTGGALVVNSLGSFGSGSVLGVLLALGGTGVAALAAVRGMQQKGQGQAALAVTMVVISLGVATLLGVLKVIDWIF